MIKRNDKRYLISLCTQTADNRPGEIIEISVFALEEIVKNALLKNQQKVFLKTEKNVVEFTTNELRLIIKMSKSQFKDQKMIPKTLRDYLISISSQQISFEKENLSARFEEIDKIFTLLSSQFLCNAVLIGDHGVGKTAIVNEISRLITTKKCPEPFKNFRVIKIDTGALLELEEQSRLKFKKVIENLLKFINNYNDKVIFYCDNLIHVKSSYNLYLFFNKLIKSSSVKLIFSGYFDDFNEYFIDDRNICKYLNVIPVYEPDIEELYPILKSRINKLENIYGVKISKEMIRFSILTGFVLATPTSANPGCTLNIINYALSDAKIKNQDEVTKNNILPYYYIDFKSDKKLSQESKTSTAYHEAGHYLVAKMSPNIKDMKNAFVSILPIEGAYGLTAQYFNKEQPVILSKDYFIDQIAYSLGGRVGEAVYTNSFSAGARKDLQDANSMAEEIVLTLGLSGLEGEENKTYALDMHVKDYLLTDEVKKRINSEIISIVQEAYKKAEKIIEDNSQLLEVIVDKLLDEKILTGDELDIICEEFKNS